MHSRFAIIHGCAVLVFSLGFVPAFSQQTDPARQTRQAMPMDPAVQMDPSMRMPPSKAQPAPKKSLSSQPGQAPASNRPITEPTVPPADNGEPMHMHMHHIDHVVPQLPVIGRSKNPEQGPIYKLEDLEQKALAHNPTLAQAQRNIEAAQGVRRQVGLPPNPTVGYYGDEIRGGSYRSGKQGFFVDQPFITGGKLGLNRKVEDQSILQMQSASDAQRYRVLNATREAYYHVLTAQELLDIKRDLANIAHSTAQYTRELGNVGQADETEILQTEVAEQQMLIAVEVQENMLRRAWTGLASTVGEAQLPMGSVPGDIE